MISIDDMTHRRMLPKPALTLHDREPPAHLAGIRPAERKALLACLLSGALLQHRGKWRTPQGNVEVPDVTIANLQYRGLLELNKNRRQKLGLNVGRVTLTWRGAWYARTINTSLCEAA